jgi:hypothetical protein
MSLLMLKKLWRKVNTIYRKESMVTVENCIKVLVRAKKMYDAKNAIVKLIRMIIKREVMKKEASLGNEEDEEMRSLRQ